jgi:hypothetical protein
MARLEPVVKLFTCHFIKDAFGIYFIDSTSSGIIPSKSK